MEARWSSSPFSRSLEGSPYGYIQLQIKDWLVNNQEWGVGSLQEGAGFQIKGV